MRRKEILSLRHMTETRLREGAETAGVDGSHYDFGNAAIAMARQQRRSERAYRRSQHVPPSA